MQLENNIYRYNISKETFSNMVDVKVIAYSISLEPLNSWCHLLIIIIVWGLNT